MARRTQRRSGTITAAAKSVDLSKRAGRRSIEKWQGFAWEAFDDVPEIKELFLWRSDQVAKLKLFGAVRLSNDERQEPVALDSDAAAAAGLGITQGIIDLISAELAAFRTPLGGQAEILRRMELNLEAVGECWVAGFNALLPAGSAPVEWVVASIDEYVVSDGRRFYADRPDKKRRTGPDDYVKDPENSARPIVDQVDDLFRVWQPHARWYGLADCALRAALTEAELLTILTNQLIAEARSRVGAGFMTIPNELAIQLPGGQIIPSMPQADGEEPQPDDPVMVALMEGMINPAEDPSHPSAVVPILIRGAKEALTADALRCFGTARPVDATLDARIDARVVRLARGLDAPPERIMGFDATTYANADQVDEDTWEDYLQPRAEFLVQAITVGYLLSRPALRALPEKVLERLCVWYDADDVIAQPDTSGVNADEMFDRFAIGNEAYRRFRGASEEDAPTPEEILERLALRRSVVTTDLAAALLERLSNEAGVDITAWAVPGAATSSSGPPGAGAAVAAFLAGLGLSVPQPPSIRALPASASLLAAVRPDTRAGRRLIGIDRDLRTRLLVAANAAMGRALELAGNRLKNKLSAGGSEDRLRAKMLGRDHVAAHMGRTAVTAALGADVWDVAWQGLGESWLSWTATARDEAITVLSGVVGGLSDVERVALSDRLTLAADDAWGWLSDSMSEVADTRLFNPGAEIAPALGEFDASLTVPPGLIRQAVARAGGAAGLDTSAGGAWVAINPEGGDAGGLAFGQFARETLRSKGAGVEGYEWDYGPGHRSQAFKPHLRLDGKTFVNFDDPVLSNGHGWPPFSFYIPGDHNGCQCDAVPIIIPPEDVVVEDAPVSARRAQAEATFAARAKGALPSSTLEFATPSARKQFESTVAKLDALHRIDPDILPATKVVKGGKTSRLGGHFSPADRGPKPKRKAGEARGEYDARRKAWATGPALPEIQVNNRGDGTDLMSFMHEFGHRTDFTGDVQGILSGRISQDRRNMYYSAGDSPAVRAFQAAAAQTDPIANVFAHYRDFEYARYVKSEHEVWARAYSQWTANKFGGPELEALNVQRKISPHYQWTDDEFATLAPFLEGVLRERGLFD